jgi:FkbM family methyltransferase
MSMIRILNDLHRKVPLGRSALVNRAARLLFPGTLARMSRNGSLYELVHQLVPPRKDSKDPIVIVEVGASDGRYTRTLQALYPHANIYCIEANSAYRGTLTNLGVDVTCAAVADTDGEIQFFHNTSPDTSSVLRAAAVDPTIDPCTRLDRVESVPSITLDSFAGEKGLKNIDFLKMDIQGAELLALKGASELLAGKRIAVIQAEISFAPIYETAPLYHELAQFLELRGYGVWGLYNLAYGDRDRLLYADALFTASV